jgi:hypothetical protein
MSLESLVLYCLTARTDSVDSRNQSRVGEGAEMRDAAKLPQGLSRTASHPSGKHNPKIKLSKGSISNVQNAASESTARAQLSAFVARQPVCLAQGV